jgi:hypothetical protein
LEKVLLPTFFLLLPLRYQSQRAALPIYYAIDLSKIGAETAELQQLEDDHLFNEQFHFFVLQGQFLADTV